jgi:glycogen synthase
MLVDNSVRGDSRVQKSARSAADFGWDVVLLGRTGRDDPEERFQVGDAEVRLLPTPPPRPAGPTRRSRLAALRPVVKRAVKASGLAGVLELGYTRFWQAVMGDRCWRRLQPDLWDWEHAYGQVIDELKPDLIHANDFRMLGVGARAALRARAAGRPAKLVWDAHEFLRGIRPWHDHARWYPAHLAYEREYAPHVDAVITVSAELADLLKSYHHLAETPAVMLNCPDVSVGSTGDEPPVPDLRAICGIGPETPLFVYGGTVAPQRGLEIMVEALPRLDGAHVALIVEKPDLPYVQAVLATATDLGVRDRVHLVPYVPFGQVIRFIATADVGVIPIHHWLNHEIALIQKFFEYSHARLPILVSDVKTMAETVRATGQGEVFVAQDVDDYVRAALAILAEPHRYRSAYDQPGLLDGWTWPEQALVLDRVYRRVLGGDLDRRAAGLRPQAPPAEAARA